MHEGDRLLQAWKSLERPACFEIVPMATRSGVSRQILHEPAASPSRIPFRRFATTRSRARTGRMCTDPDFHPGRAWSDLLFTMSDNTHRSEPHGRTHQANASERIDVFGRATSLPMQQCEQATRTLATQKRAHAHAVRRNFGATKLRYRDVAASRIRSYGSRSGGARRDRTDDLLLAKQALSQLSYGPVRNQRSAIGNQKQDA